MPFQIYGTILQTAKYVHFELLFKPIAADYENRILSNFDPTKDTSVSRTHRSRMFVLHFIVITFRFYIFSVTIASNFSVRKATLIFTFQIEIPRSFCFSFKQFTKYGTRPGNAFLLRETFSRANNKHLEELDVPSSSSLGRSLKEQRTCWRR